MIIKLLKTKNKRILKKARGKNSNGRRFLIGNLGARRK
jgi:hypothetical protein